MLGKLIAWGTDRAEAIARMKRALRECFVTGIKTNITLFERILNSQDFENSAIYTRWLDDFLLEKDTAHLSRTAGRTSNVEDETAVAISVALWSLHSHKSTVGDGASCAAPPPSKWKTQGRAEQLNRKLQS
jgi:acetyl/propionyl-CoA carboxylase alpha subunit